MCVFGAGDITKALDVPPWMWIGGSMADQIIGGMIVDSLGAFRVKKRSLNPLPVAGAITLLVGVLIVSAGTN